MKKQITGMLCGFLAFMMVFTVLSRAADSVSVAQVSVKKPEKGKIEHIVSGTGKVVQNREQAVYTEPNQIVKTIYIEEGQQVQEGDLLFELELDSLKEQILKMKQDMKIADLQSEDKASGRDAQAWQRATAQNRAVEDYSVAAGKADTAISRAASELKKAKKRLKELKKAAANKKDPSAKDEVAEILRQAYEEKQQAYQEAVQARDELKKEIEEAVKKALEDAQAGGSAIAGRMTLERELHMAENQEITESGQEMEDFVPAEDFVLTTEETDALIPETDTEVETNGTIPEMDTEGGTDIMVPQPDTGGSTDIPMPQPDTGGTNSVTPPSQAELAVLEQQIRQQNQPYLDAANEWVARTKREMEQAQKALEDYLSAKASQNAQDIAALIEQQAQEVQAKQLVYNDALTAKNDSLRTAGRAIEDASAPQASDSTGEIDAITREQQELALSKLEKLLEKDGKVTAPITGIVTLLKLTTGERTPDGTAVLLADTTEGNKLVVQVSAEQEKYIAREDEVTLKPNGKKDALEGLTVDSVRSNEENREMLDITVKLPKDTLEIGTSAELICTKTSELYEVCVPIQALHMENNNYFVYVLQETQSVLGNELTARRVDVNVLDKNETMAALAVGGLSSSQEVIVDADKYIESGSRVRLLES
ncbi:MAG: biotin/lipoyl-binding protein [Marvinbryantia sp.]|jgi:multidrug efflux pump subunit AcrA (membrane-fusion protein)